VGYIPRARSCAALSTSPSHSWQ